MIRGCSDKFQPISESLSYDVLLEWRPLCTEAYDWLMEVTFVNSHAVVLVNANKIYHANIFIY